MNKDQSITAGKRTTQGSIMPSYPLRKPPPEGLANQARKLPESSGVTGTVPRKEDKYFMTKAKSINKFKS